MIGASLLTGFGVQSTILVLAMVVAVPGVIGLAHPALSHQSTTAPAQ
jgi:hypothetical protein